MNELKRILTIALCFIIAMAIVSPFKTFSKVNAFEVNESLEEIVNPDCGFYKAFSGYLKRNSNQSPINTDNFSSYRENFGLFHLRIGLEDFSKNAGGKDVDIDSSALQGLNKTLQALRDNKVSAIIRFSYNVSGAEDLSGNYLEAEPSLSLIEKHIKSLSRSINAYSDVILSVDSGMVGPWGEQHSTQLGSSSKSNAHTYYLIVQTWLENLNEEIPVCVRRPLYFTYWANERYSLDLNCNNLSSFSSEDYPDAKRVGVYNDGYLGSSTDWGTFKNRAVETAFIGVQSQNIPYGGEVIVDNETDGIGDYNKVNYLEQEAFITHTSYLNIDWNYKKVISVWQKNTYKGADALYYGKTSEFTFVKNRLGYRLVLKSLELSNSVKSGENLLLKMEVENKGFANLLRKPLVSLILKSDAKEYELNCDIDLTEVFSKESKNFEAQVALPKEVVRGEYEVYLKVKTAYGREIYFANGLENYNNSVNAFLVGKTEVVKNEAERNKFFVAFDGNYGTLVSGSTSQIVEKGQSAIPPVFEREGYEFVGWNVDFSCVTEDLSVIAIWKKKVSVSESSSVQNSQNGGSGCNSSVSFVGVTLFVGFLLLALIILENKAIFNK